MILQTPRLLLRPLTPDDYDNLCTILQDDDVMYAYEGAFSDTEVRQWLDKQLLRYQQDGFGLYAVILRQTHTFIGQCGLTLQDIPAGRVLEVGYLFGKAYWHNGYATEAATAWRDYAFNQLNAPALYAIIRQNNIPSQNVAKRLGLTPTDYFTKHYRGIDMPHIIFSAQNNHA